MNAARKLVLLVCMVVMLVQGCVGNLRCLDGSGAATADSRATLVNQDFDGNGGLEPTRHHHGVRAAIWAAVGIIIIGAFIVDLFILPYSCYHHRHYFPCCSGLIHWAY